MRGRDWYPFTGRIVNFGRMVKNDSSDIPRGSANRPPLTRTRSARRYAGRSGALQRAAPPPAVSAHPLGSPRPAATDILVECLTRRASV